MMAGVLTNPIAGVRDLDGETSADVLAKAIEQRARVYLRSCGDGSAAVCSATVVGEDHSHLALELCHIEPSAREILTTSVLQVSMEVDGVRYVFQTRCANQPSRPGSAVIHIFKPPTIARAERRRSPRRRLRRPTKVALRDTGVDSRPEATACDGSLLNVSTEGLACRMREKEAATLRIGQDLRVTFDLGAPSSAFDLKARVINITQGGTPDHLVLGLEFIVDQSVAADRRRLREASNVKEE